MLCALRFDGMLWLEQKTQLEMHLNVNDFSPWVMPVVDTLQLHPDTSSNFAAFFALQNSVGQTLPQPIETHIAHRYLFLHLHTRQQPTDFTSTEYEKEWRSLQLAVILQHAAIVRHSLLSVATGRSVGADSNPSYQERIASIKTASPRAYSQWSTEEDQRLRQMWNSGLNERALAEEFQRQIGAIKSRLIKLGLA